MTLTLTLQVTGVHFSQAFDWILRHRCYGHVSYSKVELAGYYSLPADQGP